MTELYIFIFAFTAIVVIVLRRHVVFERTRKKAFKKDVKQKVDELKVTERKKDHERFKDKHLKDEKKKKFSLGKYKEELRKADMAIAKKNWKTAKQLLIGAIALADDEFKPILMLANVYMENKDYRRAETLYKKLLEMDGESPVPYEKLAQIYVKKKEYKKAVESFSRAIEKDEKDDRKLVALGKLYDLLMHPSLSAECYRRAAELKPREVEYLFFLANSCEKDDDFENALFTYEKILTLEPYNEKAQHRSQDVRVKITEIDKAMAQPFQLQE